MSCTAEDGKRVYHHPTKRSVDLPPMDILTLLFESEHCAAQNETVLHIEAANPQNTLTKASLLDSLQRVAHGLRHHYGIGANGPSTDTVTFISYGQILNAAALYGIIAAGGVYSAASPSSTPSELARQVKLGRSKVIICGSEHVQVATKAAKECGLPLRNVLVLDSTYTKWSLRSLEGNVEAFSEQKLKWQKLSDPRLLKESLIILLWSSGTTGLPKGVMLSHTNLVSATFITAILGREWAAREMAKGTFTPVAVRTLAHLPTSHIAGLFGYLISTFYNAATVIWMRQYAWNEMLQHMRTYKITGFFTVPSIWLRISKSPDVTDEFQHLVGASSGAAPMDEKLQLSTNKRLGDGANVFVGQTWGLSETTGSVTAPLRDDPDNTGSIGHILPGVELRLVDDNYRDVEQGQEGELLVKAPMVTNGYWDNAEATKGTFHDEWLCTGDIGVCRNGKFYVVDRKKELIKYKGLQVAPAELENLLFTHPQIKEAAVVGVPAPNDPGTDLPRAYVVAVDRSKVNENEVKEYVKSRVAPYKQLRGGVVFIAEIPKNAIGKFLRRELRDRAKKEMKQIEPRL